MDLLIASIFFVSSLYPLGDHYRGQLDPRCCPWSLTSGWLGLQSLSDSLLCLSPLVQSCPSSFPSTFVRLSACHCTDRLMNSEVPLCYLILGMAVGLLRWVSGLYGFCLPWKTWSRQIGMDCCLCFAFSRWLFDVAVCWTRRIKPFFSKR